MSLETLKKGRAPAEADALAVYKFVMATALPAVTGFSEPEKSRNCCLGKGVFVPKGNLRYGDAIGFETVRRLSTLFLSKGNGSFDAYAKDCGGGVDGADTCGVRR